MDLDFGGPPVGFVFEVWFAFDVELEVDVAGDALRDVSVEIEVEVEVDFWCRLEELVSRYSFFVTTGGGGGGGGCG